MSETIVEAISIPALLVESDGRIVASNGGARGLFGDAIRDRHYISALRQPGLLEAIEMALVSGETTSANYLTTEARRDITLEATCRPVGNSGALLVCFEDRTAVDEAGQMRRDFVANVSHELRTPLTALMGFIETLRGAARKDDAARDRFLGIMEKEASRMNRLVGDLLSLSRVEADERVRPTGVVDPAALATSVLNTLTPLAKEHNVTLEFQGLDEPVSIPGDPDQLSQVLTNLVENGVKYSRQGASVLVSLSRETSHPKLRGEAAILSVSDTGEGIDSLHIPRLTERFYRIDSHRSREMGGTGLGLAIVKHIVNRHRGRLLIESEPGRGSTFSVVLPAKSQSATT